MMSVRSAGAVALGLAIIACSPPASQNRSEPAPAANDQLPAEGPEAANAIAPAAEPKSILRPEVIEPEPEPTPLQPVMLVVPFGASGVTLDAEGRRLIDQALTSPAYQAGGRITLRGHSDTRGSDTANITSSRRRAEAVRAYLIEKGVAPDRIDLFALGEGRPIAPNTHLDGSDDPEGRARNRRVDLVIGLPPSPQPVTAEKPGPTPTPASTPAP